MITTQFPESDDMNAAIERATHLLSQDESITAVHLISPHPLSLRQIDAVMRSTRSGDVDLSVRTANEVVLTHVPHSEPIANVESRLHWPAWSLPLPNLAEGTR
jgi:hypothetical protein